MDTLVLIGLAVLAIIGFIVGCSRRGARLWIRVLAAPGILAMIFYIFVELYRSQPALVSVQPQAGYPTVVLMALGLIALLSKAEPQPPKPDKQDQDHGGALSA